jgi:hypothetical protein
MPPQLSPRFLVHLGIAQVLILFVLFRPNWRQIQKIIDHVHYSRGPQEKLLTLDDQQPLTREVLEPPRQVIGRTRRAAGSHGCNGGT